MAKSSGKTKKRRRRTGPRTPWHLLLSILLEERAPSGFQIRSEVPLGRELPRADVVLLRRTGSHRADRGHVLRGLWSMIARDAMVEFKSVSRGFRRGELAKLQAYAGLYFWQESERLAKRGDLITVLLVPALTPTLTEELSALSFAETKTERGYRRYRGGTFPLVVVEVDRVAEAERDDLLGFLGHGTLHSDEARGWLYRITGFHMGKMEELEEFEDFETKLIAALGDKVLASMPLDKIFAVLASVPPENVLQRFEPEQRLAGLDAEQRLAGLDAEQRLAGLDAEQRLAGLSEEQRAELLELLKKQN